MAEANTSAPIAPQEEQSQTPHIAEVAARRIGQVTIGPDGTVMLPKEVAEVRGHDGDQSGVTEYGKR